MTDSKKLSRRSFIQRTSAGVFALTSAPMFVPASVLGKEGKTAANDRILVGCIGVGPRGTDNLREFLKNPACQVVALCDVKSDVLAEKIELVNTAYDKKDCKGYKDFRELVARKDIDACLVATCDHWHVLASLAVVRSGKDVLMEKPMGLSLQQDQEMRKAVHKNKRIFQFGTQQRSDAKFRQACELVRNGKIGELKTINVWSPASISGGSTELAAVPSTIDYNLWLGPAAYKPYTVDRCVNEIWWYVSDYALGFIAGWGIHPIDIAYWGAPDHFTGNWEISGTGEFPTQGIRDTATKWDIQIKIAKGANVDYRGYQPKEWIARYGDESGHGTAFEGSEGWVYVKRGLIKTSNNDLLQKKVDKPLYVSDNHVGNFLDCVRSRKETIAPVDDAVKSDCLCQVSDIAIRMKRKVVFDSKKEIFINDKDANARLKREMRKPWHL